MAIYVVRECPNCGKSAGVLTLHSFDDTTSNRYKVGCHECGVRGPIATEEGEAIDKWNWLMHGRFE
jgi:Lar family restriction alleviation protein